MLLNFICETCMSTLNRKKNFSGQGVGEELSKSHLKHPVPTAFSLYVDILYQHICGTFIT